MDVPRLRLAAHHLTGGGLPTPAGVVRHLGALQAQDYGQCLWAVGSRLRTPRVSAVEAAIAAGEIVRSWPMRGTIHLVPPGDLRWMLALCAGRKVAADARRMAQLELTEADVDRAAELVGAAFAEAAPGPLSRAALLAALEAGGLSTAGQRGYHLLWRLAQAALICLGPQQGSTQTFAWLDDWVPRATSLDLDRDAALTRLATRFALSRGPVTAHDLARWAGLTVTDARRGLAAATAESCDAAPLVEGELGGRPVWFAEPGPARRGWRAPLLLAGFDEYLIGYAGRDKILNPAFADRIVPGGNGVYRPMLVEGGRITGVWRRTLSAKALTVEVFPFAAGTPATERAVEAAAQRYLRFLEQPEKVALSVRFPG
ncbi:winged helix DNA-binding domain-containing protein [Spongisporangium articulatum]|uniref:Winged helix DNA-binding domain-containing protein n=1 Tax=Spongisporangium articulatum TaxID=3362603 RepID=A0ABW8AIL3_9ACTN